MRENCQSGSMSGNRNQDQVQPDCGDAAKANSHAHRETKVTAPVLDSTLHYAQNSSICRVVRFFDTCQAFRGWLSCPPYGMLTA